MYLVWCLDNIEWFKVNYDLKVELEKAEESFIERNSRRGLYIQHYEPGDYFGYQDYNGEWGNDFF